MASQPYSEAPPHQTNSDIDASLLSEYPWMDWIVAGLQQYHQAGVPSSSTPPPPQPPPPPQRLAPSRDQYHASPAPSPPPPPPPPAPRPSVHPYHAHQNSTNVLSQSSTTSNENSVGGSLVLEFLAAYQMFEDRRKISDLVEQRKSLEKQLDAIKKEIETRTRRLNEMESPQSARQVHRRLNFAPPPQHYVPPPPPPQPERLWHYNPSPPPSVAPRHQLQHTIPIPPPPPPPNRGLKRGNSGVLKTILNRQSFD